MDKVKEIYYGLVEFIQLFMIKYKYENRGLIKKMRIDSRLNLDIEDERWSALFLNKSCYNHCAKFILLKQLEDNGSIVMKINAIGIEKWKNFVKNIKGHYHILYAIALRDVQVDSNSRIKAIFRDSDYDIFEIDNELAEYLIEYFAAIDLSKLSNSEIIQLFKLVYSLEQREDLNLEGFYKEAPALSYIIKLENNSEIL